MNPWRNAGSLPFETSSTEHPDASAPLAALSASQCESGFAIYVGINRGASQADLLAGFAESSPECAAWAAAQNPQPVIPVLPGVPGRPAMPVTTPDTTTTRPVISLSTGAQLLSQLHLTCAQWSALATGQKIALCEQLTGTSDGSATTAAATNLASIIDQSCPVLANPSAPPVTPASPGVSTLEIGIAAVLAFLTLGKGKL